MFGVQITVEVAIISAAGLVLQGTVSNFAFAVLIIQICLLKIGHFVEIKDVMSTVKDITLNFMELADVSDLRVVVPNSEVWGGAIKNYSANRTRLPG